MRYSYISFIAAVPGGPSFFTNTRHQAARIPDHPPTHTPKSPHNQRSAQMPAILEIHLDSFLISQFYDVFIYPPSSQVMLLFASFVYLITSTVPLSTFPLNWQFQENRGCTPSSFLSTPYSQSTRPAKGQRADNHYGQVMATPQLFSTYNCSLYQ